jgi:HK97 family phage prohead protease
MPIPKPQKGETEDDFISRCMSNDTMKEEYPDNDQRLAICYDSWRESKKTASIHIERRAYDFTLEEREEKTGELIGHAAVFDVISDGWMFREKIKRGAFLNTIKQDDIRALFNHNPDYVLGRNKSGTLMLEEDEKGLLVRIKPPDTQFARDLRTSIDRGDISQMSFGFETRKDSWERGDKNTPDLRTLEEVKLWDVCPVTFPFYLETDIAVRSHQAWINEVIKHKPFKVKMAEKLLHLKLKI